MRVVQSPVFRVPHGSDTEKAILENVERNFTAEKAWSEFAEKHGATRLYSGSSLKGLLFDGDAKHPKDWIRGDKRVPAFRPSLKAPMSKDAKDFKSLPVKPNLFDWLHALGLDVVTTDGRFKTPGYVHIDGTYYLTADSGCPVPDDVVPATEEETEAANARKP